MKPDVYIYILVMAGVTYLIRMLPLALAKKEITNPFVKTFLFYVPYACLAAMTFPAILSATASVVSAVVGFVVALIAAYKEKSLLTVALLACGAVFLSLIHILGFHSAAAVQYIRPEIVGLVLGSCILALATKEFKPRGGSAPVTRFVIGMFVMIGCLMFLGCPFRMILRLAGGDFNAIFGLIGFIAGILAGVFFLKKGYTLKRSYKMQPVEGGIFPVVEIGILLLLIAAPAFIHFTEADGGPGAKHAAIAISLIAGLLVCLLYTSRCV